GVDFLVIVVPARIHVFDVRDGNRLRLLGEVGDGELLDRGSASQARSKNRERGERDDYSRTRPLHRLFSYGRSGEADGSGPPLIPSPKGSRMLGWMQCSLSITPLIDAPVGKPGSRPIE